MKRWSVITLLLVSILIGASVYHFKKEKDYTDLDRICDGLLPLKNNLPLPAHLYYLRRFDKKQRYANAEYCLAPRVISPVSNTDHDSTLMIIPLQDADTIAFYRTQAGKLLWENTDDTYHYLLINAQR
jgi:hypothetical protein